ncbi:polysaccharide pyruvyl transferase family protein [Rubellicoccus peritrichatus]|uniref:Polysaccharide pyruvyl transferase family protein n=1 Tax=Rubellicoccus peritrichatus TaxID=3080537 RepID=A0AAQ3L856_9BACT|nr:polysaccharide pyruvyl transferase family protein [Puniceicoccus sp. CR14]WOO41429.1 polysaccharide pyruvyl transferase family protein [Puniceicoccus sp. CR14]
MLGLAIYLKNNALRSIGAIRASARPITGKYFKQLPTVLNLNIIDICNSHCRMCNIWKEEAKTDITTEELEEILSDRLFRKVKHVGVTGGEPTLRDDIVEVFGRIIDTLPNLQAVSIITNCIKGEDVRSKLTQIRDLCQSKGMPFSIMISIDGIGKTHDYIRGTKGNFESAIETLRYAKDELKITPTIGCTISKGNVWNMDRFLYFIKENGLVARFRVAEFIVRLYNENRTNDIRNFSDEETYQLKLFFTKLQLHYEHNTTYRRTYKNIIGMLDGNKRAIGCPYQHSGITLGSTGKLGYCAPRSPFVGDCKTTSPHKIYKSNIKKRTDILNKDCNSCIHDYHSPENVSELLADYKYRFFSSLIRGKFPDFATKAIIATVSNLTGINSDNCILIIGWYGTETIGDIAILGGIIEKYKENEPDKKIFVASFFPWFTRNSLRDLKCDAHVIDYASSDYIHLCRNASIVAMGGGPLMEIDELRIIDFSFQQAKQARKEVLGCGIGPLYSDKANDMVKSILTLSEDVQLRDTASVKAAKQLTHKSKEVSLSGDFAEFYIQNNPAKRVGKSNTPTINCFLRELPYQYFKNSTPEEFETISSDFEKNIVCLLNKILDKHPDAEIKLCHMSNFAVAHDDRDFSIKLIDKYFSNVTNVTYDDRPSNITRVIDSIASASFNICMRFHSVLFAHTLKAQYCAIDYTSGGKIKGFLSDKKALHNLLSLSDLEASDKIDRFLAQHPYFVNATKHKSSTGI